jgi:hypothetical protein
MCSPLDQLYQPASELDHPGAPLICSAGGSHRTSGTATVRLHDIEQKLHYWGYLSHYQDAERDVAWLLERLVERDASIEDLKARLEQQEWLSLLP